MSGALSEADLIETYRRTLGPLYGYVSRRVGGDASLAEDVVQDTWIRAIGSWRAKGVPAEPLAWLVRVARNTLISHFRRTRPQLVESDLLDRIEAAPASVPGDPGAAAAIGWGLAQIRRAHADLLEEFYFAGKSVREIARDRATSERAIEGRLRRAREKLKQQLVKVMPRASTRAAGGGSEHARRTPTS